jgi:hypothetical protein
MKKIHILGQARSGTTYLATALGGKIMPTVDLFYSEPFNKDTRLYTKMDLNQVQHNAVMRDVILNWKSDKSIIMKNLLVQIAILEKNNLLEDFLSADFYTILMVRRDLFQTAVSRSRAYLTSEYTRYTQALITIEPKVFANILTQVWCNHIELLQNRWGITYNEIVYYEDLSGDPDTDVANLKIYNPKYFRSNRGHKLAPQHAPDKKSTIVNYAELEVVAQQMTKTFYHPDITIENMQIKINLPGF